MSPKSAQRFWDNDMHKSNDLKRVAPIRLNATRFRCLISGFDGALFSQEMEGCTMGQVLHGSATATEAIRRAIQNSQESLRALAKRYGINQKTVAKWKKRTSVADLPTGPREPSAVCGSHSYQG